LSKTWQRVIAIIALLFLLWQFAVTLKIFMNNIQLQDIHLGFALTLVFLTTMAQFKNWGWRLLLILLLVASWVVVVYVFARFEHLETVPGRPDRYDLIIGIILIVVVLEATRQAWGLIFPAIIGVFILYFFFGHLLPGVLAHPPELPAYVVSRLGIGFSGIFGDFLNASVQYVFLFMVLGGILRATGALEFILDVGKAVGRLTYGGPAQTAVVGSGLVGTISGAAVSNVVLTGSVTIPAMKSIGYDPVSAGAIEATASTGGQIMPPVMGVAAFIMAAVTAIPYRDIMIAAIIPALLYYFQVFVSVEAIARKRKVFAAKEKIKVKALLRRSVPFVVALGILFFLLIRMSSPAFAAVYAITAALVISFLQKETRPTWFSLVENVTEGVLLGAKVGVICAAVGIIQIVLTSTGAGIKLTGLAESIAGNNVFVLLILTMIISIVLGCGVPTIGAYVLVALVVAPLLIRIGYPLLPVHFFAFYFAVLSAITPPVALASITAAGIAKANPWQTGVRALLIALGGFVIPFFILFNPSLMLLGGGVLTTTLSTLSAAAVFICLTAVIWGHLLAPITTLYRIPYAGSAALLSFFVVFPDNYLLLALGAAIFILLMIIQWRQSRALARRQDTPLL